MPLTWRVYADGEPKTAPVVEAFVWAHAAYQAWSRLTRIQRAVLKAADSGQLTAKPATIRALARHGICDEMGKLTAAGEAVLWWQPTDDEKEAAQVKS